MDFESLSSSFVQTNPVFSLGGIDDGVSVNNLTFLFSVKKRLFTELLFNTVNLVFKVSARTFKEYEQTHIFITNKFDKSSYIPYVVQENNSELFEVYYTVEGEDIRVYGRPKFANTGINIFLVEGDLSFVDFGNPLSRYNIQINDTYNKAIIPHYEEQYTFDLKNNLINCTLDSHLSCKSFNNLGFDGIIQLNSPSTNLVELCFIPSFVKIPSWSTTNVQFCIAKDSLGNYDSVPVFLDIFERKIKAYCNIRGSLANVVEIWVCLNYIV